MCTTYSRLSMMAWANLFLGPVLALAGCQILPSSSPPPAPQGSASTNLELPPLHKPGEPYRTPKAGEGFKTEVFGHPVEVPPQDKRSITAWDVGVSGSPGLEQSEALPFGSLYLWRRPDEDHYLRAIVAGLFNDISYAYSPEGFGPFEGVFSFENFTVPFDQSEFIDGERIQREELTWGYVRTGFGVGYRKNQGSHPFGNCESLTA